MVGGSDNIDGVEYGVLRRILGFSSFLQLREITDGRVLNRFRGHHEDSITNIQISPDGRSFATASLDGSIKLWDSNTGKMKKTLYQNDRIGSIYGLSYSSDNRKLAFCINRKVLIVDIDNGHILTLFNAPNQAVEFLLDDRFLMAYDAGRLIVWNIAEQIKILCVNRNVVGGYIAVHALSPDKKFLTLGFDKDHSQTQTLIQLELSH